MHAQCHSFEGARQGLQKLGASALRRLDAEGACPLQLHNLLEASWNVVPASYCPLADRGGELRPWGI